MVLVYRDPGIECQVCSNQVTASKEGNFSSHSLNSTDFQVVLEG